MASITGIVITKNEERHIEECITSLQQVCDEVIVVDSESKDRTVEIAESLGAKVIVQRYLGDGPQKNFGIPHAKHDWILSLDADERLTLDAISTIRSLDLKSTPYEAFSFRRRNYIGSRWIKVCGWYPDNFIRLYDRRKTRFADALGHARVTTENFKRLKCDLIHWSYRHSGELFSKADRFSTRGAKILWQKGVRAHALSPVLHGLSAFLRKYILKLGFIGGVDGFTVAMSSGVNSYLKYAKLLEIQRDPKTHENLNSKDLWTIS